MSQRIINGDSAEVLKTIESRTIDAVVTDPPYGIEFLGKEWDKNTGAIDIWRECLRVLKPGGFLLAFSAARTYHHLATNIESVGFDIRDQIMWIYASGFPKAQDIGKAIDRRITKQKTDIRAEYNGGKHGPKNVDLGMQGVRCPVCKRDSNARYDCTEQECGMIYKAQSPEAQQWSGWKTALKPAHEPIVMARKPMKGSTTDNVLEHGVGALNIDATRIPTAESIKGARASMQTGAPHFQGTDTDTDNDEVVWKQNEQGRFPSNVLGDIPDYQKYFYCPKVSRRERHRGFEQEHIPDPLKNYAQGDVKNHPLWDPSIGTNIQRLKHKILEHNRDLGRNKDPLSSTATTRDLLMLVGGKYVAEDGTLIAAETTGTCPGKMVWLPGVGKIFAHGLKHEVEKILKAQNRADEIPRSQGNNHPTVKPVALMKYLIKLVTPAGAHVIDPFSGSGSTGMACRELARQFTGIDLDRDYCEIARKRIAATREDKTETLFE